MLSFINSFSPEERYSFWCPFLKKVTVCRMSFSLRVRNEELFQINCNSIVTDHIHAEVMAYRSIEKELFFLLVKHVTRSSVLDFIIALNNSPCGECRGHILGWIMKLKDFTSVRLILFFSNLYGADVNPGFVIIDLFTDWILRLVEIGTVVFICPLIVVNMVPMFGLILSQEEGMKAEDRDKTCIENIKNILQRIKMENETNNNFCFSSPDFLAEDNTLNLAAFSWEEPIHLAIFPHYNYKSCLSELKVNMLYPGSYQEIISRSKKYN